MSKNQLVIDLDNVIGGTLSADGKDLASSERGHYRIKFHPFGMSGWAKKVEIPQLVSADEISEIPCRNSTADGAIENGILLIHRRGNNSAFVAMQKEKDERIKQLEESLNQLRIKNAQLNQRIVDLSSDVAKSVQQSRDLFKADKSNQEEQTPIDEIFG